MANQIIGRTLISDSAAPFGEFKPLQDRPEPTQEEREAARKADRVKYTALLRE